MSLSNHPTSETADPAYTLMCSRADPDKSTLLTPSRVFCADPDNSSLFRDVKRVGDRNVVKAEPAYKEVRLSSATHGVLFRKKAHVYLTADCQQHHDGVLFRESTRPTSMLTVKALVRPAII